MSVSIARERISPAGGRSDGRNGFWTVAILLFISRPVMTAPVDGADWRATTLADLAAARAAILANHPGPVDFLQPGFVAAMDRRQRDLLPLARAARGEADWHRVLQDFANGFADVHVAVRFTPVPPAAWPGFLSRTDHPGAPHSRCARRRPRGRSAPGRHAAGLRRPPRRHPAGGAGAAPATQPGPAAAPVGGLARPVHGRCRRSRGSGRVLSCCFRDPAGTERTVPLHWRPIGRSDLDARLAEASSIPIPSLGLRRIGDVWLVSIPSFTWENADGARIRAFLSTPRRAAPTLHAARHVVIDLRRNHGGNSAWGDAVAAALRGQPAVDAAEATVDGTVAWRPSPGNQESLRRDAASMWHGGLAAQAASFDALTDRMARANAAHRALLDVPDQPHPGTTLPAASPFTAPMLVLTEPRNISACLDFLHLLALLPGTERIGLPTGADTLDMDIAEAPLPGGRASLLYPMKVYRHRARGTNVAYQPAITWPGGPMTDDAVAVARWVDTLPPHVPR